MLEYNKVYFLALLWRGFMAIKIAVIGAGPAGYPAALAAARLGAEVTVIEKARVGGVCLHCGCIPSKSLLDAAHRFDVVRGIGSLCEDPVTASAQEIFTQLSWPKIRARQQAVTEKLTAGILGLFRAARITLLNGTASFVDAHTLSVSQESGPVSVPFDYAIVTAGTVPFVPAPFDKIREYIYTNSNIFQLEKLPQTLTIIGGGAIGCEFATLMSSLGVKVRLIEMQPRLLPNMDEAVSRTIAQSLQKKGVELLLGTSVTDARVENDKKFLTLSDGKELETDEILAAIGRACNLTELKPENAGLHWNRKGLEGINAQTLQVTENIYAAGDVTGLSLLAHAGSRQGIVAAHNICAQPLTYNNDLIPSAVYTHPEAASVGLTAAQAQAKGLEIKKHKAFMLANSRALTMDAPEGFAEIISDKNSGKLLGTTLVCANASEIISAFTVALQAGLTVDQLKQVVFPHPTLSEAIGDALAK